MGQPKDKELGIRNPIDLRVGQDVERFVGVVSQQDPGAIPRNAFQRARNIRLRGGMPVERGGQEKVITTPIASQWDGLRDVATTEGNLRLYMPGYVVVTSYDYVIFLQLNATGAAATASIVGFSPTWSTNVQTLASGLSVGDVPYSLPLAVVPYAYQSGRTMLFNNRTPGTGRDITFSPGSATIPPSGFSESDVALGFSPKFAQAWNDKMFFGALKSGANGDIKTWDGSSLATDGVAIITGNVVLGEGFGFFNDGADILAAAGTADAVLFYPVEYFKRISGVWTTQGNIPTPPYAPAGTYPLLSITQYGINNPTPQASQTQIGGKTILMWDALSAVGGGNAPAFTTYTSGGGFSTTVHTVAGGTGLSKNVMATAVFQNKLYFVYQVVDAPGVTAWKIGSFDGTTLVDEEADISSLVGVTPATSDPWVNAMTVIQGSLYAFVASVNSTGPSNPIILKSTNGTTWSAFTYSGTFPHAKKPISLTNGF